MKKYQELPNAVESETILLGMMLSSASDNDLACQRLCPQDFLEEKHVIVFSHLQALYEKNTPGELQILVESLRATGELSRAGGIAYLMTCKEAALIAYDSEEYTNIILDKSIRRDLINLHQRSAREVLENQEPVEIHIASISTELHNLGKKKSFNEFTNVKQVCEGKTEKQPESFLELMQQRQEERKQAGLGNCLGLTTGFPKLDEQINGLGKKNLIIVAARPGVGKTTLAIEFAIEQAIRKNKPVGIFSLEMDPQQIIEKICSNVGKIPLEAIHKGHLDQFWVDLTDTIEKIKDAPIHFYTSHSVDISSIKIAAKKLKEVHKIELLIIDYLQLINGSAKYKNSDSRVNEVSDISRKLKLLAMELDIPIVCLSQLNRSVENRLDSKPKLSDLRESGSIEQDADQVIFLHRPSMTNPNDGAGRISVVVEKNRHGSTGTLFLATELQFSRFKSMDFNEHKPIREEEESDLS